MLAIGHVSEQNNSEAHVRRVLGTLPAAIGFALIPEALVALVFERGAFTRETTLVTAQVLQAFAVGLPAFTLISIFRPGFYAREDMKTPMWFAIANALTKGPEVVEIGKIADYIDSYQVTTVFTSTANTTDKPDLVKRFLAGYSKGVDDYNAALVDKTMSEDDTAAIVAMVHKYVYSDQPIEKADPRIRAGAMRINANARMNMASITDQLEWFKSEKLVPEDSSMENLVDTSFVETY